MATTQELANAIAEGQRFVQLLHGVEWMTTLCQSVVDAEKLVAERQAAKDKLDAQIADAKANYDAQSVELQNALDAKKKAGVDLQASLAARVDELKASIAKLEQAQVASDNEFKTAFYANAKAAADAVADSDAKQKAADEKLAATQTAIEELRAKIA